MSATITTTGARRAEQAGAVMARRPAKKLQHRRNRSARFEQYESLKTQFTESARNAVEYEAACRRAAKLAGV